MKLWKVKVRGICHDVSGKHLKRQYFTALVEAPDSSEAMNAGCCYAVNNAPSDVLWREFEALEAASFPVPHMLDVSARAKA